MSTRKSCVVSWFDKKLNYFVLRFDIIESESATFTSEVTSHAVERGANISDHVRDVMPTAHLDGFVSQKPHLGESLVTDGKVDGRVGAALLKFPAYKPKFSPTPGGLTKVASGLFEDAPPTQMSVSVLQFAVAINRPEQVLQALFALKQSAQLVEVNAPSFSLQDCVITSITTTREPEDGSGMHFGVDFTGVRRVSSKRTDQILPADIVAKKTSKKGSKGGEDAGKPEDQSWLSTMLKATGGSFGS